MTTKRMNGQGVVEVVLILPVLLLLLAGSYVCCRATFLLSAAESSAQTETIRTGRRLAGIEQKMSDDILPYDRSVTIRSESTDKSRLLPAPFPSLAGRTKGFAEIRKGWEEIGRVSDFPTLQAARISEASVDCWEKPSGSGRKICKVIDGFIVTGFLR